MQVTKTTENTSHSYYQNNLSVFIDNHTNLNRESAVYPTNCTNVMINESFNDYHLETITLSAAIKKFNKLGYSVLCSKDSYIVESQNIVNSSPVTIESDQDLERYLIQCFLVA